MDIEAAIDNTRPFDLLEITKDIDFIPLDNSNSEGLLGDIGKIAESESRFYVKERRNAPVKLFDRSGKFIATRGRSCAARTNS